MPEMDYIAEDWDFPFLIKTMKKKYLERTLKEGLLCFNTPSTFIAGEGLSSAQQDKYEAHLSFEARHIMVAPILYEDENIIIAVKPFGLLCHSDNKNEANLLDSIIEYLKENKAFMPDKENNFTPALCNRLDQGTEGLIIAAKNYVALREMNKLIADDQLIKNYLMLTRHDVKDGIYDAFHQRIPPDKLRLSSVPQFL